MKEDVRMGAREQAPVSWSPWSGQAPACGSRRPGQAGKMLVPLLGVLTVLAVISVGALAYVLRQEQAKRHETERRLQIAEAPGAGEGVGAITPLVRANLVVLLWMIVCLVQP